MFGYDWPRFHAAVNDLPAALLLVTVLFDLGAWLTKRESLKAAALWTLWAGVIGGGVGRLPRGQAGDALEHGEGGHPPHGTAPTPALAPLGILTVGPARELFRPARPPPSACCCFASPPAPPSPRGPPSSRPRARWSWSSPPARSASPWRSTASCPPKASRSRVPTRGTAMSRPRGTTRKRGARVITSGTSRASPGPGR